MNVTEYMSVIGGLRHMVHILHIQLAYQAGSWNVQQFCIVMMFRELFVDNKSALDLAKNLVFHGRSKHIHVRYNFTREYVERGKIILKHINSECQKAYILTKAMTTLKFEKMRRLLGIENLSGEL